MRCVYLSVSLCPVDLEKQVLVCTVDALRTINASLHVHLTFKSCIVDLEKQVFALRTKMPPDDVLNWPSSYAHFTLREGCVYYRYRYLNMSTVARLTLKMSCNDLERQVRVRGSGSKAARRCVEFART